MNMNKLMFWLCTFPFIVVGQVKNPVKNQVKDTVVFKGVNKIWIENAVPLNQNIYFLQQAFSKRGYDVIVNRKQFIISTKDSLIDNRSVAYVLNGLINSAGIELSGKYNLTVTASVMGERARVFKYDIAYSGAEKGLSKRLFALLLDIAEELPGKKNFINETRKKKGSVF